MFCRNCGNQMGDNDRVCSRCGTPVQGAQPLDERLERSATEAFDQSGAELRNAFNDVRSSLSGNGSPYGGERLKTDRSLFTHITLTIITCGIYSYYFLYRMAKDVNVACEGDGGKTAGLLQFIVLSFVTCGIYAWIWYYNLGNRLAENAPRYGMTFQENGTTVLLWQIFGALLCFIGPFIAMNILIKNTNRICDAYNRVNGL